MKIWEGLFRVLFADLKHLKIGASRRFSWTGWTKKMNGTTPKSPWTYFSLSEVQGLQNETVAKLDQARHYSGIPYIITSGYRSAEHNAEIPGAVSDSSHTRGYAVDLLCTSTHALERILYGLFLAEFHRIGIYIDEQDIPTHVHVDNDPSLPPEVVWVKREGT